jgi:sialic acid synthase SpsE
MLSSEFFKELQARGQQREPLIIAEIGAKYAELEVIRQMIEAAGRGGADLVKFQTYRAETVTTPGALFTLEDGSQISQYEFFKAHELTSADHEQIDEYCREVGIRWLSTPSHAGDLDLLERFQPPAYKTGSDDLTNLPFLREIAHKGRPMIVSTGMSTLSEIEKAIEAITIEGNTELVLLHCVVSYPARPEDANLRVIEALRAAFGLPIGLSDHTTDEFTSVLATQLGVCVIEKHFTLDHSLRLPDHQAALDPHEWRRMVDRVRLVPKALGSGIKSILPTEEKWRAAGRKSIFAARSIRAGAVIGEADLVIRRPADGLHPHDFDRIVGRVARKDIPENTLIAWDMV